MFRTRTLVILTASIIVLALILFTVFSKPIVPNIFGVLEGTVSFVGTPCPPGEQTTPPCDGPYPNYIIAIYDSDGETKGTTISDENGDYTIKWLPVGEYVIFTQNGVREDMVKENRLTIQAGKNYRVEFNS